MIEFEFSTFANLAHEGKAHGVLAAILAGKGRLGQLVCSLGKSGRAAGGGLNGQNHWSPEETEQRLSTSEWELRRGEACDYR